MRKNHHQQKYKYLPFNIVSHVHIKELMINLVSILIVDSLLLSLKDQNILPHLNVKFYQNYSHMPNMLYMQSYFLEIRSLPT